MISELMQPQNGSINDHHLSILIDVPVKQIVGDSHHGSVGSRDILIQSIT